MSWLCADKKWNSERKIKTNQKSLSSRNWEILAYISSNKIWNLSVSALEIPLISLYFGLKLFVKVFTYSLFKLVTMSPSGWNPPYKDNTDTSYLGDQHYWPIVLDFFRWAKKSFFYASVFLPVNILFVHILTWLIVCLVNDFI